MSDGHCFISYSTADGIEFTRKLSDSLEGGEQFIPAWFDKRDLKAGEDWDEQIVEAIKGCKCFLFVMTEDSTKASSNCKPEIIFALRYKKPIVPILLQKNVEQPFLLGSREWIDFTGEFRAGLAKLRTFWGELDSPEGILRAMKYRLADAEHALRHASGDEKNRIKVEIAELESQIQAQEKIAQNPQAAQAQTQKNIEAGLERERKPEKPTAAQTSTKFINPPPGTAPNYFQDRLSETRQAVDFLKDGSQRLMTIIGRGGVGKTAMVCRLLKGIEIGQLPDNLGEMKADGIVYLSEAGSHRVNFTNIFYDLCKLLPSQKAQDLDAVYKNPQASTESKMRTLLDQFATEKVVLLLDNIETLINVETFDISDTELLESLHAFLHGAHTTVKIIMTTRIAPRGLNLFEPGRQRIYHLEEGLPSPYAEKMLREIDVDGTLGLRDAKDELLDQARKKTRGFPKGLEALKQILASDRYTTLEELLAMPTPENVVEALVGEAFNRLDTNAQKVMQALAVYNRPVTPAAVDYLLAPHIPAIDSAPILQRLANMHFARKESGRFYLHPADQEYAFSIIPVGISFTTKTAKGSKAYNPTIDFSANTKILKKTKQPIKELINMDLESLLKSSHSLPLSSTQVLGTTIPVKKARFGVFSQHDLILLAADYFAQSRKPRLEWKKLDDLAAQLAEFDLRCTASDYDTACSILLTIDIDCLFLWGHYRLMIELHEKLQEKIIDSKLKGISVMNLGSAKSNIGKIRDGIKHFSNGLELARVHHDRQLEAASLGNIGNAYALLGNVRKAIECYEKALIIDREIRDKKGEARDLSNLGDRFAEIGDFEKALNFNKDAYLIDTDISYKYGIGCDLCSIAKPLIDLGKYDDVIFYARQAANIAQEIQNPPIGSVSNSSLALALLLMNREQEALQYIQVADSCNEPEYQHLVLSLLGIVVLRLKDGRTACQAFTRAIAQADEILAKTPEYYSALDAKGLALSGLLVIGNSTGRGDPSMPTETNAGKTVPPDKVTVSDGWVASTMDDAIKTFRKARKIAPHSGVVKRVLRLFDELVKCEGGEILMDVRKAVEGVE